MSPTEHAARSALAAAGYAVSAEPCGAGLKVQGRRDSDVRPFFVSFGRTPDEAWRLACSQADVPLAPDVTPGS